MKKAVFYTEAAYFIGLILLAAGTALTAYGGFGLSMVVAPAYILHLYLSKFLSFFSFGVAEYCMQALIVLLLAIFLRKVKLAYLLSLASAILYGILLDGAMLLTAHLPENVGLQIAAYVLGALLCCNAIALLFCSYLPPAAYEMFVKEISAKRNAPLHRIKTVYDCGSLLLALLLSLALFRDIRGIGIGTVLCAVSYGTIIRLFQTLLRKSFRFTDKFSLRKHFE